MYYVMSLFFNMANRLETNFCRLLSQCETMAANKKVRDWRLEKYIKALDEKLLELKKISCKPSEEILAEYVRKVEFLKGLIETEKLSSPSEKALATQLLSPGVASLNESLTREIHLQKTSQYTQEMREDLLNIKNSKPENGLRKRNVYETSENLDDILKHHHNIQEKLADEMLTLANSLKHNSLMANNIIKEDNKTLDKSAKLADQNYSKLKLESERLEVHLQKSCNWWVWIMLAVVCITFLWMIIFMKLFPKKA